MAKGLLPLPSLLRASSLDAGMNAMRRAGRSVFGEADYDTAVETLDRLVAAAYGDGRDGQFRFQLAERAEKRGDLRIDMSDRDFRRVVEGLWPKVRS